jgi:hypothetical protein
MVNDGIVLLLIKTISPKHEGFVHVEQYYAEPIEHSFSPNKLETANDSNQRR